IAYFGFRDLDDRLQLSELGIVLLHAVRSQIVEERLIIVQLAQDLLSPLQIANQRRVDRDAGLLGDFRGVAESLERDACAMRAVREIDAGRVRDRFAGRARALGEEIPQLTAPAAGGGHPEPAALPRRLAREPRQLMLDGEPLEPLDQLS